MVKFINVLQVMNKIQKKTIKMKYKKNKITHIISN